MQRQINPIALFALFGINIRQFMESAANAKEAETKFEEAKALAKKEFKSRALDLHPDRNGGDDSKFKELAEMYQFLKTLKVELRPKLRAPPVRQVVRVQVNVQQGFGSYTNTSTTTAYTNTGGFWR